jgi:hypothetical protein
MDLETATGRAMLEMSGTFAEYEKRMNSERVKLAKATAKKLGSVQGRPPRGFRIDKETKKLVPKDPKLIQEIQDMMRAGLPLYRIGHVLSIPQGTIYRMCEQQGCDLPLRRTASLDWNTVSQQSSSPRHQRQPRISFEWLQFIRRYGSRPGRDPGRNGWP